MMISKKDLSYFVWRTLWVALFCLSFSVFLVAQAKLIVNVAEADVRLSPDPDSPIIDVLFEGTVLSQFESGQRKLEWYYVSYFSPVRKAHATGFIRASHVRPVRKSGEGGRQSSERYLKDSSDSAGALPADVIEGEQDEKPEGTRANRHSIKIGMFYFMPSEQSLKDIYGPGFGFGGEMNLGLWRTVRIWIIGHYYTGEGSLPITDESTALSLFALGGGPKIRFSQGKLNTHLGAGPVIYVYKEENPIGLAEGTGMGLIAQVGFSVDIVVGLILDASLNYTWCNIQPQNIKANVGGLQLGLSIGYTF